MPSGFTVNGTDLDSLFLPRGGATPGPATGFMCDGSDLNQRYHPAVSDVDRISANTGFTSEGVDLRVAFRDISYAPLAITSHPANLTRAFGQSATFSVTATAEGTIAYQWQKNGANIGGATGSSYTIIWVASGDGATYRCAVSNGVETVYSNGAVLTAGAAPAITSHPAGLTLAVGDLFSMSVVASGDGTLSYQWQKDGSNISGATGSTYSYTTSSTGDSGSYRCVVTSVFGSATSNAAPAMVMLDPPIITGGTVTGGPYNFTVGDVAEFTVVVSGTGLSYQWWKDGDPIQGANSSTLSLGALTHPNQSGTYRVVVSNSGGNDEAAASLTVNDVAPTITGGTITGGPYSFGVGAGCNFTVTATGSNLAYAWYKDGVFTGHTTTQGPSFTATEDDIGTHTYSVAVWNDADEANASTTLEIYE